MEGINQTAAHETHVGVSYVKDHYRASTLKEIVQCAHRLDSEEKRDYIRTDKGYYNNENRLLKTDERVYGKRDKHEVTGVFIVIQKHLVQIIRTQGNTYTNMFM